MDFLKDLGKDWIEDAGEQPEPKAQPEPEVAEPPAEPEATTEPEPEAPKESEAPVEQPKPAHMVPYSEMDKWKRRAQAAEARVPESAPAAPKPVQIPDAYEQPEQFGQHFTDQMDQQRFSMLAEISGRFAEQKHGIDLVEAAVGWAHERGDPALRAKVISSSDPVEVVVQEYQRSRTLDTLGNKSPEDWARDYAVSQGWIVSPETPGAAPTPKPSSPTPPRSLASRPGSGGVGQVASGDGFSEIFNSRGLGLRKG